MFSSNKLRNKLWNKLGFLGTSSDFWEQAPSDALEQEQLKTYLFQSLFQSLFPLKTAKYQ